MAYAALDKLDRVQRLGIIDAIPQHRHTETNTAEWIANLVRNLRGRLSHCGERFTASECAFSLGCFGGIDERYDLASISVDSEWRRIDVESFVFFTYLGHHAAVICRLRNTDRRDRVQHLHRVVGCKSLEH